VALAPTTATDQLNPVSLQEKIFDLLQYASKPATAAGSSAAAASPAAATKTGTPVGTSSVRSSRLPSAPAPATPAAPKGRHGQAPALLPLGGKSDTISLDIASQHVVTRPSEVMELLRCGAAMRRTADNGKNARSSRSHAIFSITVEQRPRPSGAAAGGGSPSSPGAARAGAAAAGQGGEPAGLDASSISLGFDDVGCRDSGLGGDGSGEGASCGGSGAGAVEEPSLGLAELLNSRIHFVDLAGSETVSGGPKGGCGVCIGLEGVYGSLQGIGKWRCCHHLVARLIWWLCLWGGGIALERPQSCAHFAALFEHMLNPLQMQPLLKTPQPCSQG
jgi:hypothetical protein